MRRTPSGAEFSPFTRRAINAAVEAVEKIAEEDILTGDGYVVKAAAWDLGALLQEAFAMENEREELNADDTEGLQVEYTPFSSPLTSPNTSTPPSPTSPPPMLPNESDASKRCMPSTKSPQVAESRELNHAQRGYYKRRKRTRKEQSHGPKDPTKLKIRSSLSNKHRNLNNIKTTFELKELIFAKGAWIGLREPVNLAVPTVEELREEGLEIFEWDGL